MMKSGTAPSLKELSQELKLELPPQSRLLGVDREPRGEPLVRAKLLMTKAEWAAFVSHSPIKPEQMDPGTGGFLGQDYDWWDPHAAPGLRTGQVQRAGGHFLNIGFDDSRPDVVAVYIVEHGS